MRGLTVTCLWLAALANQASSQGVYRPSGDTVFVLLVNPYRMYWVRGGDTVSQPMHAVSVEEQHWDRDGQGLRVTVKQLQLDVGRHMKVDTFTITPLGAVRQINGHAPGLNERVDFVPRLPDRTLAPGVTWADSLGSPQRSGPRGDGLYSVTRSYRVSRLFDSASTQLAEVSAIGFVHYRDSWWVDSTAGKFVSIDVTGPDSERFVLAVQRGRLVRRSWSMTLTGRGTLPADKGHTDTTAAGLIAAETQRIISPERAHLLTRPLPGLDTAVTLNGGPVLLHTVLRHSNEVESGMARSDGLIGTAHARFVGGVVETYEAFWTDTSIVPRQISISVSENALRIREPGGHDSTVAIPEHWWGVADYAMNELLVPVFLAHPADGVGAPFAIYRPYARHWDVGTGSIRPLGENFVASYRLGRDTVPTYLLITKDGDLLMGENSGPTGAQRMPREGSARRARLDDILRTLHGNH